MFDDCKKFRRMLESRYDGGINPRDLGALETHLAVCASCREAAAADNALSIALADEPCAAAVRPEPFDLPILDSLNEGECVRPSPWQLAVVQAIAGTLAAAAVTALVLSPVLKSTEPNSASASARMRPAVAAPGVSLQRLLNAASPQAALLWTKPRTGSSRVSPG